MRPDNSLFFVASSRPFEDIFGPISPKSSSPIKQKGFGIPRLAWTSSESSAFLKHPHEALGIDSSLSSCVYRHEDMRKPRLLALRTESLVINLKTPTRRLRPARARRAPAFGSASLRTDARIKSLIATALPLEGKAALSNSSACRRLSLIPHHINPINRAHSRIGVPIVKGAGGGRGAKLVAPYVLPGTPWKQIFLFLMRGAKCLPN